jgi:hypothetical protein
MEVIAPTGVKIYNVSAGKTLPEWMEEKKKKSLKRNPGMTFLGNKIFPDDVFLAIHYLFWTVFVLICLKSAHEAMDRFRNCFFVTLNN